MNVVPQLNIFVICTMTKRFLGTGNLMLREVGGASLAERFANWTARIKEHRSPRLPAIAIYSGGHWSVVRSFRSGTASNPMDSRLWIVSAGYGLVSPENEITPYGATFAPGNSDSISVSGLSAGECSEKWWGLLSGWRPPGFSADAPRSIAQVTTQNPDSVILLVLSPDYFRALRGDLCETLKNISDPERLIILTSDERELDDLANNTVRVDARLQIHLGGARTSLAVRTARAVLQELTGKTVTIHSFRAAMEKLVDRHAVVQVYDRQPMTNEELGEFIQKALESNASISSTRLLGELRNSGRACERKRFHRIFITAKEQRCASSFALNDGSL